MSTLPAGDELLRRRRELRLRIGRSRRRIDERLHAIQQHSRALVSWQTYVSRSGVQWAESLAGRLWTAAGSEPARKTQRLGLRLLRQTFRQLRRLVWIGVKWLWAATKSRRSPAPTQQGRAAKGDAHE